MIVEFEFVEAWLYIGVLTKKIVKSIEIKMIRIKKLWLKNKLIN